MKASNVPAAVALATALFFSSCSSEEVVDYQKDAIGYSVTANALTRALDSYCNTALPASFTVWAGNPADNSIYIAGDVVENRGGNPVNWVSQGGTRYWPTHALNFFAHVNGGGSFDYNAGAPRFNNFTVVDAVGQQVDLMYAAAFGAARENGAVNLNFRHALTQVCFRARNTNPSLKIEVRGVEIGHIGSTATFAFPSASTSANYENAGHDDSAVVGSEISAQDTWTDAQTSTLKNYGVTFASPVTIGSEVTNLTCPEENHKNGFANVLTLIPQTVPAWNPTQGGSWNGAYFIVDCVISDATNGTEYHNGKAAIPVSISWLQGRRYVYTFVFSNGTGGFLPDPSNPEPVLAPISYTVTVDDFMPADGGESDVNGGFTEAPDTHLSGSSPGNGNGTNPWK